MRYENNTWHREDNWFFNTQERFNYSGVRLLHTGVDTVKELYNCLLRPEIMMRLEKAYENSHDAMIEFGEYGFLISKSSKRTGYQWILRNNDLGIVILLKNFYTDADKNGSHIKIEGSPHLIACMNPTQYSEFTGELASLFATQLKPCGVAVHLCVDIKGWQPEKDFEYKLVTRSKRKMSFAGISNTEFNLSEVAAIYGNRETYTFGSASSIQMCVYDKVTEAIKSDKIDFWEQVWRKIPSADDFMESEYQDGDNVTRLEFRFHHSVVQQFGFGSDFEANNYAELQDHLNGLFQYALNNFRLHHSTSYIHPVWQILQEDVLFFSESVDVFYKRAKKQPDNANTKRRTAIWLGNTIRLHARKGIKASVIVKYIMRSGLEDELMYYFGLFSNGLSGEREDLQVVLTHHVEFRLEKMLLEGIAA